MMMQLQQPSQTKTYCHAPESPCPPSVPSSCHNMQQIASVPLSLCISTADTLHSAPFSICTRSIFSAVAYSSHQSTSDTCSIQKTLKYNTLSRIPVVSFQFSCDLVAPAVQGHTAPGMGPAGPWSPAGTIMSAVPGGPHHYPLTSHRLVRETTCRDSQQNPPPTVSNPLWRPGFGS